MDTPRPVLKKRITISRWGPALNAAEKAENIDKAQPVLPNGTGSDSKDGEEKIVCRIVKVTKEPDNEEKPPEDLNSSQKSSDEEQNSSETSDFLGFSDCGPEKQHSFLKVLDNIEQNKKEEGIEEQESTEHQGLDSINADIEKEKMTVDTRPEEEDESNDSLDKSNSDEMEIDVNKESEVIENDSSSMNTTETVQQKPNEEATESVQDEENQENIKNEDDSEFTIKEEVLSLNDDEGKEDLEDKPNESFSGSENDGSISGNRNDSPLIEASNAQGLEDVSQLVNDRQTMETPEPTILNGSPAQSSGKKKGRTRESMKAKKPPVDVSHPAFLKPFDFGWKRELVYRSTNDTQNRRQSDIYYYTPKGKKVRSFREVLEHLVGQDLTIDNFTFFKEPLGVDDPEKEIIRDAKLKMKDPTVDTPSPILKKSLLPKTPKTPKTTPVPPQETSTDTPSTPSTPTTPKAGTPRVVFRGGKSKLANFGSKEKFTATQSKNSVPGQANKIIISKVGKRSRKKSDEELEMGMLPPLWQPNEKVAKTREKDTTIVKSAGTKRSAESVEKSPPVKKLKFDEDSRNHYMQNYVQNMAIGYKALLQAFQYLTVQELLRAGRVCHMWRDIAMHKSLWETVRMKNSRVRDWEGVSQTLRRVGTRHLDLRKIIIPDKSDSLRSMWSDFIKCISKVNTLVKLDLCRCSSQLIEQVAAACPQLENLNALSIRSNELNLAALGGCKNMTELRLKSVAGIDVSNVIALKSLTKLKHLSLTSVKNMTSDYVEVLNKMVLLETLELGECTKLPEKLITESLPGMTKLRRLRLEKGQGTDCPTILLLETISRCSSLTQLELINFDVKPGFDNALALCSNIKTLLIIPTYVTQSATTNHVVMEGVSKLSKTLTYFVWGLTLELLRVTDLFIDQWEGQKNANKQGSTAHKKSTNDCIPILKPEKDSSLKNKGSSAPLQVDVLQLAKLHKVLMTLLPTTQIKILKVPFSATWRQTIPGSSQ